MAIPTPYRNPPVLFQPVLSALGRNADDTDDAEGTWSQFAMSWAVKADQSLRVCWCERKDTNFFFAGYKICIGHAPGGREFLENDDTVTKDYELVFRDYASGTFDGGANGLLISATMFNDKYSSDFYLHLHLSGGSGDPRPGDPAYPTPDANVVTNNMDIRPQRQHEYIYKSEDEGDTWQQVFQFEPDTAPPGGAIVLEVPSAAWQYAAGHFAGINVSGDSTGGGMYQTFDSFATLDGIDSAGSWPDITSFASRTRTIAGRSLDVDRFVAGFNNYVMTAGSISGADHGGLWGTAETIPAAAWTNIDDETGIGTWVSQFGFHDGKLIAWASLENLDPDVYPGHWLFVLADSGNTEAPTFDGMEILFACDHDSLFTSGGSGVPFVVNNQIVQPVGHRLFGWASMNFVLGMVESGGWIIGEEVMTFNRAF